MSMFRPYIVRRYHEPPALHIDPDRLLAGMANFYDASVVEQDDGA
jgi:hypothetical protein